MSCVCPEMGLNGLLLFAFLVIEMSIHDSVQGKLFVERPVVFEKLKYI